ncbi:MAG: S-methyl-5-thioribose-1-phosphate isomerase [Anaerolineae bacterium]|nr:S-methyl-5-thioribose-1-phosphate isomerase [Anaerolineae bacterium]
MRTVGWDASRREVQLIDQRCLPGRLETVSFWDYTRLSEAIRDMVVRGAPAIGVTAAFGIALAADRSSARTIELLRADLAQADAVLRASRPTAVNLFWALDRMKRVSDQPVGGCDELRERLLTEALQMAEEDIVTNRSMAVNGAALIQDGDTIIHHCNTGALAAVDWGTALGCIREAWQQGKRVHVLVDETRPRLQGARLTAWELTQYGIPFDIISDNAAGYFLRSGQVQRVMFGADRVAANGDVANKIGTYMLALAAHANQVPVIAVMPASTIDRSLKSGDAIPIEERDAEEVLGITVHGERVTPEGATARNPAFDVTPNHLITALVTELGVVHPPFVRNLASLLGKD